MQRHRGRRVRHADDPSDLLQGQQGPVHRHGRLGRRQVHEGDVVGQGRPGDVHQGGGRQAAVRAAESRSAVTSGAARVGGFAGKHLKR
ncbi:hypothetical protein SGPA1_60221 [Streptomyces misionensis JCM 4497]